MGIIIDTEFHRLIPPLSSEEYAGLEASILAEGCRDAVLVWLYDSQLLIVDGNNRYEICTKHNLPYETKTMFFDSRELAKEWIIRNQFGRRNLSAFQRSELALQLKPLLSAKAKKNQSRRSESVLQISAKVEPVDVREEISKIAGVSHDTITKVEKITEKASEKIKQDICNGKISINKAYKDIRREEKREQIKDSISETRIPDGLFDVVYADPPWSYEFTESKSREIENQYPTMGLDEIKDLKVPSAENCVLILWSTSPKLEEAMQVLNAWGFTYKTCAVWDKETIAMGYWWRQQHEILLLGVKGNPKVPDPEKRQSSVFREKRSAHSKKPEHYYEMIESMFPNKRYIELFARNEREGWSSYGNQI